METSEERAVAQLAADIVSGLEIPGITAVKLLGDDDGIKLPAIVVSAFFVEHEWALKNGAGTYGARYRLDVELRANRTAPGTAAVETMLGAIVDAFNEIPNPIPESAAVFAGYLVEKPEASEPQAKEETRSFVRSYTVFALFN